MSDGAIDPLTQGLKIFERFAGETLEHAGGWIADWLAFHRAKRKIKLDRLLKMAEEESGARGVEPRPVPLKLLQPIIENGTLEDDDDMVRRWAALLVSASQGGVPPSFTAMLNELSADDARLLQRIAESQWAGRGGREWLKVERLLREGIRSRHATIQVNLGNLRRLGLIESPIKLDAAALRDMIEEDDRRYWPDGDDAHGPDHDRVRITDLGLSFIRACTPAKSAEQPLQREEEDE